MKYIIILLLCLLLFNCMLDDGAVSVPSSATIEFQENFINFDVNISQFRYNIENRTVSIDCLRYISAWVEFNIDYITDLEYWNDDWYWQTPEETYTLRHGDCEDKAILYMYFVYKYFSIESVLWQKIIYRGKYHAVAVTYLDDGSYYVFGMQEQSSLYEYTPIAIYDYWETLYIAENIY